MSQTEPSPRPRPSARTKSAQPAREPEPLWVGWVVRPGDLGQLRLERVRLPQSVVEAHRNGQPEQNAKAVIVTRVERDLLGEAISTGKAWR